MTSQKWVCRPNLGDHALQPYTAGSGHFTVPGGDRYAPHLTIGRPMGGIVRRGHGGSTGHGGAPRAQCGKFDRNSEEGRVDETSAMTDRSSPYVGLSLLTDAGVGGGGGSERTLNFDRDGTLTGRLRGARARSGY